MRTLLPAILITLAIALATTACSQQGGHTAGTPALTATTKNSRAPTHTAVLAPTQAETTMTAPAPDTTIAPRPASTPIPTSTPMPVNTATTPLPAFIPVHVEFQVDYRRDGNTWLTVTTSPLRGLIIRKIKGEAPLSPDDLYELGNTIWVLTQEPPDLVPGVQPATPVFTIDAIPGHTMTASFPLENIPPPEPAAEPTLYRHQEFTDRAYYQEFANGAHHWEPAPQRPPSYSPLDPQYATFTLLKQEAIYFVGYPAKDASTQPQNLPAAGLPPVNPRADPRYGPTASSSTPPDIQPGTSPMATTPSSRNTAAAGSTPSRSYRSPARTPTTSTRPMTSSSRTPR